mmetsp:Transcript_22180/g.46661  ORF Transcript_22180/g.46661 Transcript_22180/m.46661 type:complete len:103 (+) Transcript_22180:94-402(+)
MSGRHQCDQQEHNYVADAFNWEQRVKGEKEAARSWPENWGEVFAPHAPKTNQGKIRQLQKELDKLPVQGLMSNSQMSYTSMVPYPQGNRHNRKSSTFCDDDC